MKPSLLQKLTAQNNPDPKRVRLRQLRQRSISPKPFIVLIAVIVALLAIISVKLIFSHSDESEETSSLSQDTAQSGADLTSNTATDYINTNVLLIVAKENMSNPYLLAQLNISSEANEPNITYIPLDAQVYVNKTHTTMQKHFSAGGIDELMWAVREFTQQNISKYIWLSDKGFEDLIKIAGGEIEVEIKSDINYSYNGVDFIIESGKQTLTPDNMLRYFNYLCQTREQNADELTDIICNLISKLLNGGEPGGIVEKFDSIINCVTTDISAMDISKYSAALDSLIEKGWPNS